MSPSAADPATHPDTPRSVAEEVLGLLLTNVGAEPVRLPEPHDPSAHDVRVIRVDAHEVDLLLHEWADLTDARLVQRFGDPPPEGGAVGRDEAPAADPHQPPALGHEPGCAATDPSPAAADPRSASQAPPPAAQQDALDDVSTLYARLRELDLEVARIQLQRSEIIGQLVARQTAADLADVPEPTPAQRGRANIEAVAAVVDSVVAATGGRRGDWEARAAFARAPEPATGALREAVAAGAVSFEQASAVVAEGEALHLPSDERAAIAQAVTQYAARRCEQTGATVGRREFRAKLRRELVKRAGSTARRGAAHDRRELWLRDEEDGSAVLGIRGADARCVGAYRRVDAIARALRNGGDARTLAQLRSDVALDLLLFGRPAPDAPTAADHPGDPAAGWPTAVINVVVSAASLLGLGDEPGLVEDTTVAAETIRRLAHRQDGTWRRIVTDEVTGLAMNAVVTAYRPPERMARVVRARDGRCRAPGCTRPAAGCELDHVIERHEGGQTCGDNLQSLCRLHHSKKTRHHWAAAIAENGNIEWRLPDGRTYATYPMDYRELGRDVVDRVPGRAAGVDADGDSAATTWATPAEMASPAEALTPDASAADASAADASAADASAADASAADASAADADPLGRWLHGREDALQAQIERLRAALDTEVAAHRACRSAFEEFRGANPPF